MRMKKILILAAMVAMTAACSHNYEVNPVSKNGGAIGFGSYTETLTRAEARVQGTNTFLEGDTFAVYGSKKKGSDAPQAVFNNVVVTLGASTWDYENHRFWDTNVDSYTFYAVSPSTVNSNETAALNTTTGRVDASTAISFDGNNNDILVADSITVAKGSSPYFNNYHTVDLQFNHIASLFDLYVRKSANIGAAKVTIDSVKLVNIDATGTFEVNNYSTSNHPAVTWTVDGGAAKANYTNASGVYAHPAAMPDSIVADAAGNLILDSLIVMPQTFRNDANIQQVQISYKITPNGGDTMVFKDVPCELYKFDNNHTGDNPHDTNEGTKIASWDPGKHYTFYITIDANAIMFTASITDWTLGTTGYYYLMN